VDRRLDALSTIAALNRRLFLNCLEGMSDADLSRVPAGGMNTAGFVACHLLDARSYLAQLLGGKVDHSLAAALRAVKSIGELAFSPSLEEVRAAWEQASDVLAGCLELVPPEHLASRSTDRLPVQDQTLLGTVAFLLQHESYHIGQLSLTKKLITGTPMKYR
jgi:uncharacterized damage-inducible protein DinB